jgi:hypothetical protein
MSQQPSPVPTREAPRTNRRRKGYSSLYTYHQFLDYYRANQHVISQARGEAIEVQSRSNGYLVPLAQPERGLIPLLLDAQAAEEWVCAARMYPPPLFPEGNPVPDGACGRGVAVPSRATARYDLNYISD